VVHIKCIVNQNVNSHIDCIPSQYFKLNQLTLCRCLVQKLLSKEDWLCSSIDREKIRTDGKRDVPIFSVNPVYLLLHNMAKIHGNKHVRVWIDAENLIFVCVEINPRVHFFLNQPLVCVMLIHWIYTENVLPINIDVCSNVVRGIFIVVRLVNLKHNLP
jgi:hypothetical protein